MSYIIRSTTIQLINGDRIILPDWGDAEFYHGGILEGELHGGFALFIKDDYEHEIKFSNIKLDFRQVHKGEVHTIRVAAKPIRDKYLDQAVEITIEELEHKRS